MIAIVDSGGSNIASIIFAFKRLGKSAFLTSDRVDIQKADYVILPGVGTAQYGMRKLNQFNLVETLKELTQPVLGICLGMQLLCDFSFEGDVTCLGIVPDQVVKFTTEHNLAIPHMGWNTLNPSRDNVLLSGLSNQSYVYFVHSYCVPVGDHTCATTIYGAEFTSVIQRNNFFGTQFHPERSGDIGMHILTNFLRL